MESRNVAPGFEQTTKPQREESSEPRIRLEIPEQQTQHKISDHPEGKVARPHRCNDRLEDLIQALFEGDPRRNLPGPAKLFYQCLQSNPGEEPSDPFFFLKIDPPGAVKTEPSK